jgi:hypothetical protein
MRETSGEFSAREANRQGQGRRELAEHCSERILATGTPSLEAQGEVQSAALELSTIRDGADRSTPGAARKSVFSLSDALPFGEL